ncbi:hypothetical protein [Lacisediminimonas profundi]|uniref:hypothetical protein n=1 Tax=Lacisediminimonas profundi TaxID=2603856 RepID=UPI00124B3600|nr:hypothetical protein [Lacisediminimonas profundi]
MGKTFSDNWYRIADLRLGLRPTVSVRLHRYRNEPWYVLHERTHNSFHRVSPATWRFLTRLSVDARVDDVWRESIESDPLETPGQEDVFQLLSSLYRNNLIMIAGNADEGRLLEREEQKKRKPLPARMSEMMFMRIPLVDPEPWLRKGMPLIRLLISPASAVLVLLLAGWGLVELIGGGSRAWNQAETLLQADNVVLLYLAIFVAKGLHELGHAAMCKRFGGEVRTMGVMLLMLTPLPYVDVSSSWAMRDSRKRALIGAAGMLTDMVVASAATIVWANSPPGVVNEIAYNLMFSTAIYTLVFNINPLMRFDGYYILSDLIGVPNLHEQAKSQFNGWFRRRVLAMDDSGTEQKTPATAFWLAAFFVASNIYRLTVMLGIVLFIADAYFGIGLLVALALMITTFVTPLQKAWRSLTNPYFLFQHKLLVRRGGFALGALVLAIVLVPVPDNRIVPGVAEAVRLTRVFTEGGGVIRNMHVASGSWVEPGTLILELDNPELDIELAGVSAQIVQAQLMEAKAISESGVDQAPLQQRLETLDELKASLLKQKAALTVKAAHAGYWLAPESDFRRGAWVQRGAELGQVIDDRSHRFVGVIQQEAGAILTGADRRALEVRFEGERGTLYPAQNLTLVPHSSETLPSAALSPLAGGEVAVTTADPSGKQSAEPFFLLQADLPGAQRRPGVDAVRNGRSGWIKIKLPASPLAVQAWVKARQFFQRRYQV